MATPLRPDTLRRVITSHLSDGILSGQLRPGERIVENKLARELRVARSTLREALQELEHKGLVVKHDNRFSYVTRLAADDVEDIYDVRAWLEPHAAALAHPRLTPDISAELGRLIESMRSAGSRKDYVEFNKNDLAFHQLIWKTSGRKGLERALTSVSTPLFAYYVITLLGGADFNFVRSCEDHTALLAALKEGGPEEVRRTFQEKLELFRRQYLQRVPKL